MSEIIVRASELDRVMNCPGSLHAARLVEFEPPETDYAKEGTAAHFVVECAFGGVEYPAQAPNGFEIDETMIEHAEQYVTTLQQRLPGATLNLETRCDFALSETVTVRVKPDIVATVWNGETLAELHVQDYKYGWRPVSPKENWQLIAGAVGTMRRLGQVPPLIHLSVYQPRIWKPSGNLDTWTVTPDALLQYYNRLSAAFETVSDVMMTGDYCVSCPVAKAASCPAFRNAAFNAVDVVMNGTHEEPDEPTLARELEMLTRASEVMKQHLQFVQDVAKARIEAGRGVPGWTLQNSYGNRYFKDFDAMMKAAKARNGALTDADFYEPARPKSPSQIEKLKGVNKEVTAPFTSTPMRGKKLAPFRPEAAPPPIRSTSQNI